MSNLPISSKYVSTPNEPVSDAEREDMVARVNAAYADGSLSEDAFPGALDLALSARTLGELRPVAELLPVRATYDLPANVTSSSVAPGELTQAKPVNNRMVVTAAGIAIGAVVILIVIFAMGLL